MTQLALGEGSGWPNGVGEWRSQPQPDAGGGNQSRRDPANHATDRMHPP